MCSMCLIFVQTYTLKSYVCTIAYSAHTIVLEVTSLNLYNYCKR